MKSAQYWVGYWDNRDKMSDYDLADLIVDIQNDAIRGAGSTPVAKKSGTPPERNIASFNASTDPLLNHHGNGFYVLNYNGEDTNFEDKVPDAGNTVPQTVKFRVTPKLFAMGLRPTEPMIWVAESHGRWVLVPQNEWKDNTTSGGPELGVGYS